MKSQQRTKSRFYLEIQYAQNGGDKGTVKIKNNYKTHLQNYFFNLQGIRVHTLSFSVSQKRDRLASL